ncbi:FAD-dependent monooxygenase [Hymenobacter negativus]|nr:FAD-dependent monooxygenase [Hymenobacter negativus]
MATAPEVLVAGAGPSGLLLALELCRHGVRPRIIDPLSGPSPLSRAVVMHARTLELLDRHGLAEQFIARGEIGRGVALRRAGRVAATARLGRIGEGLSPFPFVLIISQDQTEGLLREALATTYGVQVEWGTSLVGVAQGAASISASLQQADGVTGQVHIAYVVGCDGAHSAVRHALGIGFPGGTYDQQFFVADTVTEGLDTDADAGRLLEIALAPRTFNAFFPMPQSRTRIIGLLPAGVALEAVTFADVQPALEAAEHIRVREVSWFATYRVHHRVAERFRQGRAFLVGDAGHIHSPAGGQGMNTGLGDAVNLGWKLAAMLRQNAPEALLDTYEAERISFARLLVATTDRAFTAVTRASAWVSFMRTQVVPRLLPVALQLQWVRRLMFRTISQTGIKYPHSPLSGGRVGAVTGGMRLPWTAGPRYAALHQPGWHLLSVGPVPAAWAQAHGVTATEVAAAAGEKPGTVYLVRPDGYVGLAAPSFNEAEFSLYARHWGLAKRDVRDEK